jgi:DNA-binding winged helix-turn-helix (wHTH) protein
MFETDGTAPTAAILEIEDCHLDLAAHTFVDSNGREVRLSLAEMALLTAFVGSPRRVLSRDRLSLAIAGRGAEPGDRSVDMLVARLRRKIEATPKMPRLILSVRGGGYKLAVQPRTAENGALPATDLDRLHCSDLGGVTSRQSKPERRQLTVFSCKLAGSLALAATLDPEDFGSTVQRFQEICITVITNWGGVVISSVGDEILASPGSRVPRQRDGR